MPKIQISPETFERLQKHGKPFVDTPESVINRALDALERSEKKPVSPAPDNTPTAAVERLIDPLRLPNMRHTKILDAKVAGAAVKKPSWNTLLKMMVRSAMKRGITCDEICRLYPISMVAGQKTDKSYKYLPDIDVSMQGQQAHRACRAVVKIAQNLGIALDIGFKWPNGERRRIRTSGAASAYPSSPPNPPTPLNPERLINPLQLPNMKHTKVLEAKVAGMAVKKPRWNTLLEMMVRSAMNRGITCDEICRLYPISMVAGQKTDEGYRYLYDIDISIQGQEANTACRAIAALAQNLDIALDIGFEWRDNPDAAYPSQRGRLKIPGSASA